MSEASPLFERVFAVVRRAVAESLAVPEDDVRLASRLIDELGADSLDFVDIVFTLDRELDIRVRDTEFNFLTRLDFSSPEVMRDGALTQDVVERLATWIPELRGDPPPENVTPRQLFSMITIEAICRAAEKKLLEDASGREAEPEVLP